MGSGPQRQVRWRLLKPDARPLELTRTSRCCHAPKTFRMGRPAGPTHERLTARYRLGFESLNKVRHISSKLLVALTDRSSGSWRLLVAWHRGGDGALASATEGRVCCTNMEVVLIVTIRDLDMDGEGRLRRCGVWEETRGQGPVW